MRNEEISHLWAHQTQETGKGSNFFFEGPLLYSYGKHFCVANLYKYDVVLINSESRSPTTMQHIALARRALDSRYTIIEVERPEHPEWVGNHTDMLKRIDTLQVTIAGKRKNTMIYDGLVTDLFHLIAQANAFNELMELGCTPVTVDLEGEAFDLIRKRIAGDQKKKRAENKKHQAQLLIDNQVKITEWLNGGAVSFPYAVKDIYIRLEIDRQGVQVVRTSRNTVFPATHCAALWRMIERCMKRGEGWKRNGQQIRLGHFSVDYITKAGNLKAGCHSVKFEQMEHVAEKLNLIGAE